MYMYSFYSVTIMTTISKGSCDVKIYWVTQNMKRKVYAIMQKYYFVFYPHTGPDPGFSIRGGVDPFWGGFGLQRGHFSVKMYAKMKELGPGHRHAPPRSAYDILLLGHGTFKGVTNSDSYIWKKCLKPLRNYYLH